jgi:hypothetical protein
MARTALTTISDKNPIGMIVDSMLTEAQFQALNGTGWILADGRNIGGSAYATITGQTTAPNLRGVYRRGKNNGRSDGNQNPDGELAIGAFQGDVQGSHTHGPGQGIYFITQGTGGNLQGGGSPVGIPGQTAASGGNETRVRAVTVNVFIKINE